MTIQSFVKVGLLGIALLLAHQAKVSAQSGTAWKSAGDWDIYHYRGAAGAFCGTSASYSKGTTLVLTGNPKDRTVSMLLVHDRWKSIVDGQEYPVIFYFDGVRSSGEMNGTKLGEYRGIEGALTRGGLTRFMNANAMTVVYKGEVVAKLSLAGTTAAVNELKNCQLSVNPSGWPTDDNPPDPFRR